jgi:protein-disulfide isomerase
MADFLKGVIDPAFIKSCIESGKYDGRIASDSQVAASLGVNGTPGFFVNTTRYAGAYSWTDMKSVADEALK